MVALVLGGVVASGTLTSCDDDDDDTPGIGHGGRGGSVGTGTAGRGGSTGTVGNAGNVGTAGGGGVTGAAGRGSGGGSSGSAGTTGAANYTVQPNGAEEVPANGSPATSTVMVTLNQATGEVSVSGTFSGLTSMVTAAHIHGPAAPGMNAAIIVPLDVTGTTSGNVSGTATMSAANMMNLLNGMTYVNIHSAMYPQGEIRAQIVPQ
jgi:hypothetical protein